MNKDFTFAKEILEASGCGSGSVSSVDAERGLHSAALRGLYCRSRVLGDRAGRGEAGGGRPVPAVTSPPLPSWSRGLGLGSQALLTSRSESPVPGPAPAPPARPALVPALDAFFPRRPLTWTDCPLVPSCFLSRCSRHSGALVTSAAPAVDGMSLSVGHHPKQTSPAGARRCGGARGGSRGPRREPSLCCGRRLVCFVNN